MIDEKWAEIEGFPDYAVSNHGRVKSVRYDRVLKPRSNSYGLNRVVLYRNLLPHDFYIHRLVAVAFEVDEYRPARVRRVMINESEMIFRTVGDCADYIGGHPSSIYRVLRGERPSHLGYTFKYVEET